MRTASFGQIGLLHRLQRSTRQLLQDHRQQLARLAHALNSVSPLSTLQRGYSITFDEQGQVLRDAGAIEIHEDPAALLAGFEASALGQLAARAADAGQPVKPDQNR